ANAPAFAPAMHGDGEKGPERDKTEEEKETEVDDELHAVVQDVMTHFMGHHLANFRQSASLEQVVVERDPGRAEESGDIRANSFRLPRSIHFKDLGDWDLVCARHGEDRLADRRVVQRL